MLSLNEINELNLLNWNSDIQFNFDNSTDQLASNISNFIYRTHTIRFLLDLSNSLLVVYPWFMIIFGTFSNCLSFIVLTRPKLRKSSTFFYLSCLSIIDLFLIYTFCINFIFLYQFNIDLQLKHILFCKLYSFLIYFLPQFSAWTCAAVSLDRVVSVIFSVRGKYVNAAKKWNTPKKAFKVMITIFICLFFLNIQFFFYPNEYEFIEDESIPDINLIYCSPENIPRFQKLYNLWVHIDLYVNVLIPFGIMIASSIIIVIGILKSTKNLSIKRISQDQIKTFEDRPSNMSRSKSSQITNSTIQQEPLVKKRKSINFVKRASTILNSSVSSKAKSVSYMLATNNFVFISLTLPIVVFLTTTPPFNDPSLTDYDKAILRTIKVICIILMNSNCAVNIFVYSCMASEFRHQLFLILNKMFCFCFDSKKNLIDKRFQYRSDMRTTIKHNSSNEIQEYQSKRASSSK